MSGSRGLATVDAGSGPLVVLLHGQPGTSADWTGVVPLLAERFRVLAPDRPGYGLTGGRATDFAGNATAVAALLEELDAGPAVVVGHSWAGGAAIHLAASAPDRVAGLVLAASVGPDPPSAVDRALALPPIGKVAAAVAVGGPAQVLLTPPVRRRLPPGRRAALEALLGRPLSSPDLRAEPNHAEPHHAEPHHAERRAAVWRSFAAEQRAYVRDAPGLAVVARCVRCPVTILAGSQDRFVPPETARRLAAALPAASVELVELPGLGHLLPQDAPGEIAAAVAGVAARAG